MTRLVGGAHSDVGRVRSVNQDAALASDRLRLYAVADGMGGHRGGEVASALALEALTGGAPHALDSVDALVDLVLDANDRILDRAHRDAELFGMGTTLCAVALVGAIPGATERARDGGPASAGDTEERVAIANVGDSRVYLLTEGVLIQLTEDHSLVQDMVREGQLTAEEAAVHPRRNILTRALGIEPEVDVDWWERAALVGDRYLLCSDGLFNEVSEERIAAVLRQIADPEGAAKELVSLANARGGRDNVTCVVVDVVGDDGPSRPVDPGPTAARKLEAQLAATEPVAPPEPKPRRFTLRLVGFLVLLAALAGGVVLAVRVFADRTYFVAAAADDRVGIFQGRPGGILWFDPQVVETLDISVTRLTESQRAQLDKGYETSSADDARRWATRQLAPATTTTTTTSTTTTTTTTGSTSTSAPPGATTAATASPATASTVPSPVPTGSLGQVSPLVPAAGVPTGGPAPVTTAGGSG